MWWEDRGTEFWNLVLVVGIPMCFLKPLSLLFKLSNSTSMCSVTNSSARHESQFYGYISEHKHTKSCFCRRYMKWGSQKLTHILKNHNSKYIHGKCFEKNSARKGRGFGVLWVEGSRETWSWLQLY